MKRTPVIFCAASLVAAGAAFAQTTPSASPSSARSQAATQPNTATQPQAATQPPKTTTQPQTAARPQATETRPNARYPHPSGQDSQPDKSSGKTKLAAAGSKKDRESGQDKKSTGHSRQVDQLARRKIYTGGSSGSKSDTSTACSTARPTTNGEVDCGTTGDSATLGHIVTKPH